MTRVENVAHTPSHRVFFGGRVLEIEKSRLLAGLVYRAAPHLKLAKLRDSR
jgi:hypothetical protein